jgi:hypothetical protein
VEKNVRARLITQRHVPSWCFHHIIPGHLFHCYCHCTTSACVVLLWSRPDTLLSLPLLLVPIQSSLSCIGSIGLRADDGGCMPPPRSRPLLHPSSTTTTLTYLPYLTYHHHHTTTTITLGAAAATTFTSPRLVLPCPSLPRLVLPTPYRHRARLRMVLGHSGNRTALRVSHRARR